MQPLYIFLQLSKVSELIVDLKFVLDVFLLPVLQLSQHLFVLVPPLGYLFVQIQVVFFQLGVPGNKFSVSEVEGVETGLEIGHLFSVLADVVVSAFYLLLACVQLIVF